MHIDMPSVTAEVCKMRFRMWLHLQDKFGSQNHAESMRHVMHYFWRFGTEKIHPESEPYRADLEKEYWWMKLLSKDHNSIVTNSK